MMIKQKEVDAISFVNLCLGSLSGGGLCPGGSVSGGSLSLSRAVFVHGGSLSRGVSAQGSFYRGGSVQGGLCPGSVSEQGGLCQGDPPGERPPCTVRYASYWNAFLFKMHMISDSMLGDWGS